MKVVYTSIAEDLQRTIEAAFMNGTTIKYLCISKSEWEALVEELDQLYTGTYRSDQVLGKYDGVTLVGYKYHAEERKKKLMNSIRI